MNANEAALEQIREEARILARMEGPGRGVILEDLLSRLRLEDPGSAELFGNLLSATEAIPARSRKNVGAELARQARPAAAAAGGDRRATVDMLVVAPKNIEEDAVIAAFGLDRKESVTTSRLRQNGVAGRVSGHSVIVCSPRQDGNVNMALYVSEWLNDWRPKVAALVGMAGGRPGWVKPGDIVLGEGIYDYQIVRRVATPEGKEDLNRFLPYPVRADLIREMRGLGRAEWQATMKSDCIGAMKELPADRKLTRSQVSAWKPELKPGGILAGSTLIEDNSIEELAKPIHDRANSVEMEGAGFAAVMEERRVSWLTLRGIADMGGHPAYQDRDGETRTKHWQFAATFAAAHLLRSAFPLINDLNNNPGANRS